MPIAHHSTGGPRPLFFSGGTALRETSRELAHRTRNSIHVITPFDSGGSSAVIRKTFAMPAVGDIRNRLMALSDLSVDGNRAMYALFTYRFSQRAPRMVLIDELKRMAAGKHVLVDLLPEAKRIPIQGHFRRFLELLPADFDLCGASVGNMILTAGYLDGDRSLSKILPVFSDLAEVRGVVRPVVEADLHLAARLGDGTVVVGQHRMTGKEKAPLESGIEDLWLTRSLDSAAPVSVCVDDEVRRLILSADLICYPIGSFYTSVLANLLPDGVGEAIAVNPCPKVFVPNPVRDHEVIGQTVADQVRRIVEFAKRSGAGDGAVLDTVLVDTQGEYPEGLDMAELEAMGVKVVDWRLITDLSAPLFDAARLADALLEFR